MSEKIHQECQSCGGAVPHSLKAEPCPHCGEPELGLVELS